MTSYLDLLDLMCDVSGYLNVSTTFNTVTMSKTSEVAIFYFIYRLLRGIRRQSKRQSDTMDTIHRHRPLFIWITQKIDVWSEMISIKGTARIALLAIETECIQLMNRYPPLSISLTILNRVINIMPSIASQYNEQIDFTTHYRLLNLATVILKNMSIDLPISMGLTLHYMANSLSLNELQSITPMLQDQSDFCFDTKTREWPPASLMRRLILCILYYTNHSIVQRTLTNNNNSEIMNLIDTLEQPAKHSTTKHKEWLQNTITGNVKTL
ncbi:hypothetical protein BDF19DRAFT_301572 [Syncephalis fuscata]|nr:hypothetical protein BDF19DRAFT_301572 [Syncephalis fuscata]